MEESQGTTPRRLARRTEVIIPPGPPPRALAPARATALSDWASSLVPRHVERTHAQGLRGERLRREAEPGGLDPERHRPAAVERRVRRAVGPELEDAGAGRVPDPGAHADHPAEPVARPRHEDAAVRGDRHPSGPGRRRAATARRTTAHRRTPGRTPRRPADRRPSGRSTGSGAARPGGCRRPRRCRTSGRGWRWTGEPRRCSGSSGLRAVRGGAGGTGRACVMISRGERRRTRFAAAV